MIMIIFIELQLKTLAVTVGHSSESLCGLTGLAGLAGELELPKLPNWLLEQKS